MTETSALAHNSLGRAHRDLVRATVFAHGPRAIAERLRGALGGWLLLLDANLHLRAAIPESTRAELPRIVAEVRRRTSGAVPSAMSIVLPTESVSIRTVVVAGQVRGYLVVGSADTLSSAEHLLVETATYLLADELRATDDMHRGVRNDRLAVVHLLLNGHDETARSTGEILGAKVPDGNLRVALIATLAEYADELLEAVESDAALRRIDTLCAEWRPGSVALVLPTAEGDLRTLEAILRRVPSCAGAVSEAVPAPQLPQAWGRVCDVVDASPGSRGKLLVAGDVVEAGLLQHLTSENVRAWARSALRPVYALNEVSKVDFVQTLLVHLSNNGQANESAKQLGIHRHTLRYRMKRIEEAVGRDLNDPTVRAEIWLAFQMSDDR